MSWHDVAASEGFYGCTGWSIEDVHSLREQLDYPKWTDEEADDWLQANVKYITDAMISNGWVAMETLLPE